MTGGVCYYVAIPPTDVAMSDDLAGKAICSPSVQRRTDSGPVDPTAKECRCTPLHLSGETLNIVFVAKFGLGHYIVKAAVH